MKRLISLFVMFAITCQVNTARADNCPEKVLSYWKLNETIAGNYIDNIGNFNAVCDGTCPSTETDGVVNRAQRFDGVGTGITVSPDDAFNWASDADFSIEMWVKRDASPMNPGGEVLVGRIDDTTLMEWRIEIRTNDKKAAFKLVATNGTGSATEHIAVSSKIIANDKWHHIVAIRDAALNTNVLYVDGEEEASVQSLAYDAGFGSATSGLNIGWINDTQDGRLKGALDEVAIYNRVLTEKEIKSHYYLARGYCNELDTQIKIMPMGDSITKDRLGIGDTRPNAIRIGYRKQLYDDLFNNDYWFDLVGSEEDGDETLFDNDHAAWGGIDVENLYDILHSGQNTKVGEEENITYPTPYLDVYPTEFILLHIGTNDVSAHGAGFPNTEMSFLNQILDEIDQASQQTTVLLAKIINRAPGGNNADTIDFNAAVDTLAHTRVLNGDKIIVVNMEEDAGLDYMIDNLEPYTRDFRDNLHPNPKGYPKMGSHWFSILDTVLPRFSAPLVTSDAIELAEVDGLYSYTVTASGTAPFTFSLEEAPAGMVIDELSGLIEWTPVTEGNFDVTVRVVNAMPFGAIGEDFQSFSIDVVPALVITGQAELTTPVNVPISIALTDLEIEGTDTAFPDGYTLTIFDGSNYSVNNNQITPTSQFNGRLSVPLRINNGIRQSNVFNLSVDVLPGSGSGGGGGGGGCFISNLHFN